MFFWKGRSSARLLHDISALAGGSELEIRLVHEKIDGDGVADADFDAMVGGSDLDVIAFRGNVQILDDPEDVVLDLIVGIAIDDCEARLLRHFIFELIFRDITGDGLNSNEHRNDENGGVDEGFELAFATLSVARGIDLPIHAEALPKPIAADPTG